MRLNGRDYDRTGLARLAGDTGAAGGVRAVVLDDGAERGIRALEFRTGAGLSFDVLVDRAMDLGTAEFRGNGFGWRSATGFRHPGLHEYRDDDGLSMMRSFSGLLLTAGLDHTLFSAEVDASQYRYPPRETVWNGLHGRVGNIPARLHGYGERWSDDGECVLWAEGEVRQAAIFGEHLRLTRRIEADVGGTEIRLIDTVRNAGFDPTPHMYLYHVNIGWPFLDEGARCEFPFERTTWQSDSVAEQGVSNIEMPAPQKGFIEQVYEHELKPDAAGKVRPRLVNERLGVFFELEFDTAQFPAFFQWLHLREGAYAIGFEPSTHHVQGEAAARENGSMTFLEPGEERRYETAFRVGEL
ncbi:aldose 1-epimerase family protein [Pseudonocardia alaniniphila]|uniref:Aldose 1-epimerase family protein n=1 Tax=Pseudonocardia alaniniphila TaxID=75291 RepID=A0ABS9TCR5_9PSEU|nr:aldose 1-epimerase family protein [Pseudonocardia alaniniphila]MCH6166308.1 aldose 1-epimerase family protein [Pseudonocardia alaniniphila]